MKKFFKDFKDFAVKGNMMTMAVGIIIGAAFTAIVTSLVNDILMPLITILTGKANVEELFFTVGETEIYYGKFIQAIIVFIITAFVVFLLVKGLAKMAERSKKEDEAPEEPAGPTSEELLAEIRDLMKEKK